MRSVYITTDILLSSLNVASPSQIDFFATPFTATASTSSPAFSLAAARSNFRPLFERSCHKSECHDSRGGLLRSSIQELLRCARYLLQWRRVYSWRIREIVDEVACVQPTMNDIYSSLTELRPYTTLTSRLHLTVLSHFDLPVNIPRVTNA